MAWYWNAKAKDHTSIGTSLHDVNAAGSPSKYADDNVAGDVSAKVLRQLVAGCYQYPTFCKWAPTLAATVLAMTLVAIVVSIFSIGAAKEVVEPDSEVDSASDSEEESEEESERHSWRPFSNDDADDSFEYKRDESDWSDGDGGSPEQPITTNRGKAAVAKHTRSAAKRMAGKVGKAASAAWPSLTRSRAKPAMSESVESPDPSNSSSSMSSSSSSSSSAPRPSMSSRSLRRLSSLKAKVGSITKLSTPFSRRQAPEPHANHAPPISPALPPRHNSGPTKAGTSVVEGSLSSLAVSNAGSASSSAPDPLVKKKIPPPTPPRQSKRSRNVATPIGAMGKPSERSPQIGQSVFVNVGTADFVNSVANPPLPPRHRSGLMRQGTDKPSVSMAPSEVSSGSQSKMPKQSPILPPRRPPNKGRNTIEDWAQPVKGSVGIESVDEGLRAQESGGLVDSKAGIELVLEEIEDGGEGGDLHSNGMENSSFFSTGNMADLDYSASENEHNSDGELDAIQSAISVAGTEAEAATRDLGKRFAEELLAQTAGDLNGSDPSAVMSSTVGARTTKDFVEVGADDDVGDTIRAIRRRDFDYIHGDTTPVSSGRLTSDELGDTIRAIRNRDVNFFGHKGEHISPLSKSGSETELVKAHAQAESSMLLSIKKLAKGTDDGASPMQEAKSLRPPQSSSREGAQPAIDVAALVGAAIVKGIGAAEVPQSEQAVVRTARPPPRRPHDPRRYRHSPPDAMSDAPSSLRGRLKEKEVHISMLLKQLEAYGESGIQEVVSLETAKKELQAAFKLVMDGDDVNGEGDKAIAKWDKYIQNHPEHIAEQEQLVVKWNEDNKGINAEKLRLMRTYVPPDIWSTSQGHLRAAGLKPDVAQRIWSKKVIWFVRAEQSRIARIHAADLDITYSIQGLDIMELRAVWASLPTTFENDGDNRKAAWRDKVATKLKEMVAKDQRGALNNVMKRARCYGSDRTATGPFDPDAPLVTVTVMRGNSNSESADDLKELCKTGGSVASRRSSLPDSSPATAAAPAAATVAAATRRRSAPLPKQEAATRSGARRGQDVMSELTATLRTRQGKSQSKGSGRGGAAPSAPRSLMDELRAKQKKRQGPPKTPPPAYELVGTVTATKLNDAPTLPATSAKPTAADEVSPPPSYHSLTNRSGQPPAANDVLSQMAKIRMMSTPSSPTTMSTREGLPSLPSPLL